MTHPVPDLTGYITEGHRLALEAAVHHAVLTRAVAVLTRELARARARQRAIDRRWIPQLEQQAYALDARLDELEREDIVRLRWSAAVVRQQRPQGNRT